MYIKTCLSLLSLTVLQACAFALKPVAYSAVLALKVPVETADAGVNLTYAVTDEMTNTYISTVDISQQTAQTIMMDTVELSGHFIDPDDVKNVEIDKVNIQDDN